MENRLQKKIYLGSFNAESYFSDGQYCKLPLFSMESQMNSLFNSMDELMLPMLEKNDVIITRYGMDASYKDYYESVFYDFTTYSCLSVEEDIHREYSIFQLIQTKKDKNIIDCLTDTKNQIIEYSLIPDCYELYDHLGLKVNKPKKDIIGLVNNKAYSNELKYKLDLPCKGIIVNSIEEFVHTSYEMLSRYSSILIKDIFGVSGQGILVIQNDYMVKRLEKHFEKQECDKFTFLLEPYLHKQRDFSCQFTIDYNGNVTIQGYQENNNRKFTYLGSSNLSSDTIEQWNTNYMEVIDTIAKSMYMDGYHGLVCVDSMILNDHTMIPLVEINARLSMGRFNLMTCNRLKQYDTQCSLIFFKIRKKKEITYDQLMQQLESDHILYQKGDSSGVIPMAPNTWRFVPVNEPHRMYFQMVYQPSKENVAVQLKEQLLRCLEALEIQVLE